MQLQLPLTYGTLAVTPANMKAISGTAGELVVHMATPQQLAVSTAMAVDALPTTVPGNAGAMGAEWGRRLLAAARAGDTALVRALVARGAPFAADWLGAGPLHAAAAAGHADTVAALLRAGVSRDARTKVERTPLHLAAYGGHLAAARALLAAGAAAAARDLLAMTPLHWAAERGHAAVAALLLRHGADPRAKSKFLKTPLQLAREPAVAALLREAARAKENMASVAAVVSDRAPEGELTDTEPESDPIHIAAAAPPRRARARREPPRAPHGPLSDIKVEPGAAAGAAAGADNAYGLRGGAAGAAGARLLRAHGITLLPADSGSTVLTALQSGRTVMLSDAGKLMLKESGHTPAVPTAAGPTVPTVPTSQADVVLRAAPVRHAPAKGVKVFTLAAPHSEATGAATTTTGAGAGAGGARPTVKIFVNRANLDRLVPRQDSSKQESSSESEGETVSVSVEGAGPVRVPRRFLRSRSHTYLRARLLAAHAALRAMGTQLADAQARIAALEANQQ